MRGVVHFVLVIAVASFARSAHAAKMRSACYLLNQSGEVIGGVNVDQSYEIASVTKLFTSYFSLARLGPDYRFQTQVFFKKVNSTHFDVHIKGGRDPYSGREMMQFLIAELNKFGIMRIRNLSFDENFKFIVDVRSSNTAHSFFRAQDPMPPRVQRNLRTFFNSPMQLYAHLRRVAEIDLNLKLPERIQVSVANIIFVEMNKFENVGFERPLIYQSAPLALILKEMNRNSNNHAANQIFEFLGGHEAFHSFYFEKFPSHSEVVKFYNGSGDRVYTVNNKKLYNMASCRAVIEMMVALDQELKKFGLELYDIMPVAGQDAEGQRSTVTPTYNSESTQDALIGKTGTVNPSVTLAGKISTQSGEVFFNYIYGTNGTDWGAARRNIRGQVIQLISRFGGREYLNYTPRRFIPFDRESILESSQSHLIDTGPAKP